MSLRKVSLGYLRIEDQGKQYVMDALNNNRVSRGKYTAELERRFAALHQTKHAVFCNSGTSALQISLAALKERYGYREGDEAIVPALTFIATSNIVLQNNMRPVFVDVDPYTYNLDPERLEDAITPRTRVIVPVHLLGLPCEMEAITSIARNHSLQIMEDSAETMFACYRGRPVGSWGELGCFSTYIAHILVSGVGGLVTTNDPELATMCRSLMAHGRDSIYLSIDDDDRIDAPDFEQMIARRYNFVRVGYSYRATELEAALALAELDNWKQVVSRRRANAARLTQLLRPWEEYFQLPTIPPDAEHSFMMYPFVARDHVDREPLLLHLERQGIETRYLFPLLSQPVYRRLFPGLEERFPVAQRLSRQGFFIGIHQGLTEDDLHYVAETLATYFGNFRRNQPHEEAKARAL